MNQTITIDPWFQNKVINTEEKLPLVSRTTCVPYERIPHYEKHKVKKRENQVGFAMLKWYDHHIMMESIFLICLLSWESKWFDSLLPDYWVYQFDSTSSVQKDQIHPVSIMRVLFENGSEELFWSIESGLKWRWSMWCPFIFEIFKWIR